VYDRGGRRLRTLALPPGIYLNPRVSPDGRSVAFNVYSAAVDREAIETVDLDRDVVTLVTPANDFYSKPVWTADGRRVVYGLDRNGGRDLYWKNADGSGEEHLIANAFNLFNDPNDVTPDGRWLIFRSLSGTTSEDLWIASLEGAHEVRPLIHSPANEITATVSPDGRWLAYRSDESGSFEVYVQSFPALDHKVRVSVEGSIEPSSARMAMTRWRQDGRELYFIGRDGFSVMAADVIPGPELKVGKPHVLVRLPQTAVAVDVAPDGQRLYVVTPTGASSRPVINLLLNWAGELKGARR
jgi:Tol biopolymer transport system component